MVKIEPPGAETSRLPYVRLLVDLSLKLCLFSHLTESPGTLLSLRFPECFLSDSLRRNELSLGCDCSLPVDYKVVNELLAPLLPCEGGASGSPSGMVGGAGVKGPPGAHVGAFSLSQTNHSQGLFSDSGVLCGVLWGWLRSAGELTQLCFEGLESTWMLGRPGDSLIGLCMRQH